MPAKKPSRRQRRIRTKKFLDKLFEAAEAQAKRLTQTRPIEGTQTQEHRA